MTIATKPQQTHLSLTAFLELPETKPASEYINGQIFEKPMPQGKHSTLQSEIVTLINQIAKSGQIAYMLSQNYVVTLQGDRLCQIFLYLSGQIFPSMRMASLRTKLPLLQIG